jgi:transketolase
MRDAFRDAFLTYGARSDAVFLTGDLGFKALEPIRDVMGQRFINCGVAEQNMMSVAAALSSEGFEVWVYSIATFCILRPFEQIRNDIALHRLPVRLVGNGGGFAYGVMGPTHHALEDYALLLTLPGVEVFVPAFDADLPPILDAMRASRDPCYLRLGRDERPVGFDAPAYAPWRRLLSGDGPVVVTCGPICGSLIDALRTSSSDPELWVVSELTSGEAPLPVGLAARLSAGAPLAVVEEHVGNGGLGGQLARQLLAMGISPGAFRHLHAQGFPYERYGSQLFHRAASGLDPHSVRNLVESLVVM